MPKRIPRYVGEHLAGAYLLLVCVAALSFLVLGILYIGQSHKTQRLAKDSLRLSMEIQQQRRDTIFQTCRAQNDKHANLVNFIAKAGIKRGVSEQADLTYKFIDVLAPKQNCREVVRAATNSG